jgi:hypothetical protein
MRTPAYNEVGHREIGAGNAKKKRCANHILPEYGGSILGNPRRVHSALPEPDRLNFFTLFKQKTATSGDATQGD